MTAERWAGILRELGHRAVITQDYDGRPFDALVVLHASRGAASAARFRKLYPGRPLIVALTGTDIYNSKRRDARMTRTFAAADALIALQPAAVRRVGARLRRKVVVIYQSAQRVARSPRSRSAVFDVVVVGGLRAVKDPLRTAYAARRLPASSRVRVTCAGPALSAAYGRRTQGEVQRNPRFRWIGAISHTRARTLIAAADLLVISSRSEGGANVLGEAAVAGVPVLSSRIEGTVAILGAEYPGLFPYGDTGALTALLQRCESDAAFYAGLRARCRALAPLFARERELASWRALISATRRGARTVRPQSPARSDRARRP